MVNRFPWIRPGRVDPGFYRREYPDVALAGLSPELHYRDYGRDEKRYPNSLYKWIDRRNWSALLVNPSSYLKAYTDVAEAQMSARTHYARWGRDQGRYPSAFVLLVHVLARALVRLPGIVWRGWSRSAGPGDPTVADLFLFARFGSRVGILLAGLVQKLALLGVPGCHQLTRTVRIRRFPDAAAPDALVHLIPAKRYRFADPQVIGEGEPQHHTVEVPARWLATVEDASIIGAFQVVSHGALILYEPAADPHCGFVAGSHRYVSRLGDQRDKAVVSFTYKNRVYLDTAILLSGRCSPNYFHVLIEYISKIYLLERLPHLKHVPLIVDAHMYAQEFEALRIVADERPLHRLGPDVRLDVGRLHVVAQHTFHPDGLAMPYWMGGAVCEDTLAFLRDKVLSVCPPPEVQDRRIFLARRTGRNIGNADEIEAALANAGFEIVDPERLTFLEQVRLFREAHLIVGAMGAAFSNLIFCRPGTKVLALASPFTKKYCLQSNLAQFSGCQYRILAGSHPSYAGPEHDHTRDVNLVMDSFTIAKDALLAQVERLAIG